MTVREGYQYATVNGNVAVVLGEDEDGDTGMTVFVGTVGTIPYVVWSSEGKEWTGEFPELSLCLNTGEKLPVADVQHAVRAARVDLPLEPGRDEKALSSLKQVQTAKTCSGGAAFFAYVRTLPADWMLTLTRDDGKIHAQIPLHLFLALYHEEANDELRP